MSGPLLVVDTNVVVSGLLTSDPDAPTRRVLDRMLTGDCRFALSELLLLEYREVVLRPAIREAHALGVEEIDEILVRLVEFAVIAPAEPAGGELRADGDEHLFRLLEQFPEALLVTGDRAVLQRAVGRGRTARAMIGELEA